MLNAAEPSRWDDQLFRLGHGGHGFAKSDKLPEGIRLEHTHSIHRYTIYVWAIELLFRTI